MNTFEKKNERTFSTQTANNYFFVSCTMYIVVHLITNSIEHVLCRGYYADFFL